MDGWKTQVNDGVNGQRDMMKPKPPLLLCFGVILSHEARTGDQQAVGEDSGHRQKVTITNGPEGGMFLSDPMAMHGLCK